MKTAKLLQALLAIGVSAGCMAASAEASNLDTYRNLLLKKQYTIKYQDITPEPRVTNKDKIPLYGKNDMERGHSVFLLHKQTESVAVCDGDNRYEEISSGPFTQCRLQRGLDTYVYLKHDNAGKTEIFGNKKNSVAAVETNLVAQTMLGSSYGSSAMSRYLNAMLPNENKTSDQPVFRYVTSGWLDNGLNYEDYKTENNGVYEAVRYYFNGYTLVKIAAIQYWKNAQGVLEGKKTIIKINEFSPTPDQSYLNLPAGVKDSTKRKKK